MDLKLIKYFITLAEELNFGRAAERLYMTQPPLSRQIKKLEEQIGANLFHRTKHRVELTNAGKVFLKNAYQILDQFEQACISTRLTSVGQHSDLKIAFTGTAQDIIPIIKVFRKKNPFIGIVLQQMNNASQIDALQENRIDLGLVSIPTTGKMLNVNTIVSRKFMVALPESHPFASSLSLLYMHDLTDEHFIMTPRSVGASYFDTVTKLFFDLGFTPKTTIHANDLQTVYALVSADLGIALTPCPIHPIPGIIFKNIENINQTIEISAVWKSSEKSKEITDFIELSSEYFSDK